MAIRRVSLPGRDNLKRQPIILRNDGKISHYVIEKLLALTWATQTDKNAVIARAKPEAICARDCFAAFGVSQ
jgi:hypothetical protein